MVRRLCKYKLGSGDLLRRTIPNRGTLGEGIKVPTFERSFVSKPDSEFKSKKCDDD